MPDSTVVKLLRPYRGQGPGELLALPMEAATSLVRKGIAVPASSDLVALYRGLQPAMPSRQPEIETAMAADAPEMAVTRRGTP